MKLLKFLTVPDGSYKLDMFLTCHWHLFSWDIWQAQCHAEDLQDRDGTLKKKTLQNCAKETSKTMAQKLSSISVNCGKRNKVQQSATSSEIHRSIDPSKINESHRFSTGLIGWMAQKLHKAWHFADQNILQGETSGCPFFTQDKLKQPVGKTSVHTLWMEEILHHLGWLKPYE